MDQLLRIQGSRTVLWVLAVSMTVASATLYGFQIAQDLAVQDEMRRTCDSHATPGLIDLIRINAVLGLIGVVCAGLSAAFSRRWSARAFAIVLAVVCGVLFLTGVYGTATRTDVLAPLCTNL